LFVADNVMNRIGEYSAIDGSVSSAERNLFCAEFIPNERALD